MDTISRNRPRPITQRVYARQPDRNAQWNHPTRLSILTPMYFPGNHGGVYGVKWGHKFNLRLTADQYALVLAEATALGMYTSEFVRWCAVMAAKELHKERTGNVSDVQP